MVTMTVFYGSLFLSLDKQKGKKLKILEILTLRLHLIIFQNKNKANCEFFFFISFQKCTFISGKSSLYLAILTFISSELHIYGKKQDEYSARCLLCSTSIQFFCICHQTNFVYYFGYYSLFSSIFST